MIDKNEEGTEHINCFSCEHFYITHEPRYPYGCKIIGFKSARMPSVDVQINSKMKCGLFVQKEKKHEH
ncbi:MAG: uracil-DNA glycosylase [Smithella sp.]